MLCDGYTRKIEYIRLSVTDLCNLRCRYCMPLEGVPKRPRSDLLTFEEITRLVSIFAHLGVRKVRITGGEPLLRKDLPKLISLLRPIPGLEEVLLTTNGILLKDQAKPLVEAGLNRINIHLDTLDGHQFTKMTRWGNIQDVLAGIQAAQDVGLTPIKLNCVLLKGFNDWEIESMVQFAAHKNLILRFIELMPIGPGKAMNQSFLPTSFVLDRLAEKWTLLPFGKRMGLGPAQYFKIVELDSVVGLIHPVSKPFCEKCNRLRISADGSIQYCLAYSESNSLRDLLRKPETTDSDIAEKIKHLMAYKRFDHEGFSQAGRSTTKGMYRIGG